MIRISDSVGLFSSWMMFERARGIEGKDHMVGISGSVGLFSSWMMFEGLKVPIRSKEKTHDYG